MLSDLCHDTSLNMSQSLASRDAIATLQRYRWLLFRTVKVDPALMEPPSAATVTGLRLLSRRSIKQTSRSSAPACSVPLGVSCSIHDMLGSRSDAAGGGHGYAGMSHRQPLLARLLLCARSRSLGRALPRREDNKRTGSRGLDNAIQRSSLPR